MGCWMGRWSHPGTASEVGCIPRACLFGDSSLHFLKESKSNGKHTCLWKVREHTEKIFTFRKTKVLHCYSFGMKETPLRSRMLCGYVISCFSGLQWRAVVGALSSGVHADAVFPDLSSILLAAVDSWHTGCRVGTLYSLVMCLVLLTFAFPLAQRRV